MSRRTQVPSESLSSFAYGAVTLYGSTFQKILLPDRFVTLMCQALQPREHIAAVWATPISLATTLGIISFPEVTKMFQFTSFPLQPYGFRLQYQGIDPWWVSPFGHPRI